MPQFSGFGLTPKFDRVIGNNPADLGGVRALAVDKDHHPRWNPAQIADVEASMVAPYFESPWPAHAHPLRDLD